MSTTELVMMYVLIANYTVCEAVRDGLCDRGKTSSGTVGWKQFHHVLWQGRWPIQTMLLGLVVFSRNELVWMLTNSIAILLIYSLHAPVYRLTVKNRDRLTGDDSKFRLWIIVHSLAKKIIPWL